MLRAAQPDAGRAERDGVLHLARCIGVGPDLHLRGLGAPRHDLREVFVGAAALGRGLVLEQSLHDLRRGGLDFARENLAGRAVDGEEVALLEVERADLHRTLGVVDLHIGRSAYTDFTHLPGDKRGVRADTAACGQDAVGGDHAAQILR